MTKRDLPESPIQSSKRLRTSADDTGALLQLIENAEELTHCLQSLTEWKDGISRNNGQIQTNPSFVRVREQLAGLSKKLSPIFQQLDPSQDAHHSGVKVCAISNQMQCHIIKLPRTRLFLMLKARSKSLRKTPETWLPALLHCSQPGTSLRYRPSYHHSPKLMIPELRFNPSDTLEWQISPGAS